MRIVPIPSELNSNPYIKILYTAVSALGVEIVKCDKLTFRWLLKNARAVDVLHIHWPETHYIFKSLSFSAAKFLHFFALIIFAKLLGCRIIWTAHNILGHEKTHPKLDMLGKRLIARLADGVIAHCDYAAGLVKSRLKRTKDIYTIPHLNYISYYKNDSTKEQARERLKLAGGQRVYLLFGTVRRYKGILELIDAFSEMKGGNLLLIAGKPQDELLREEIAQKVAGKPNIKTFFRFIDGDEVQYFFNSADFVILPYKDIVTSGALILAMSFKKPVIAPAIGCFPEELDESAGILYNPDADGALLEAIKRSEGKSAALMGEACYQKALSYDPLKVAALHIEVYEGCRAKS